MRLLADEEKKGIASQSAGRLKPAAFHTSPGAPRERESAEMDNRFSHCAQGLQLSYEMQELASLSAISNSVFNMYAHLYRRVEE